MVAVGLGAEPEKDGAYSAESLRRAAGSAARALAGSKKAVFALPVADAADLGAVAEGALLGAYSFDTYKENGKNAKGGKNGKTPLGEVALLGGKPRDKAHKAAVDRAVAVAEELNRARDLINTPPNDLNPAAFADIAQSAAKEHGLKVQVLDEKALTKGGYGGILGVGAGSASAPRLVKLSYTNSKADKHLAFVGKGITYDSGGISLKPAGHNETMKCDMSGAAAVFAAVWRPPGSVSRSTSPAGSPSPRTCRPVPPPAPATCCACTAARPSRSSTRTRRAGWSSPTRCGRPRRRTRTRSWTSRP